MMHYLIGRDIDNDGRPEFIQNMETMAMTEDPAYALQFTSRELEYIDMAYFNAQGFYALEAPRYGVSLLERMLFRPPVRGYRPPVAPPPRRSRGPVGGPAPRGGMGGPGSNAGPRGGMGGPGGGAGPRGGMGGPASNSGRSMGGPGGAPRGGMGGPGGHGGMGGPGGRVPGGR